MPALELYWFNLDVPATLPMEWHAWLSAGERARAARFLAPTQDRRFVSAHAHLRWLLGRRLGCAPAAVTFTMGPHGKPELPGAALQFNLSHSGRYGLVGIHPDRELGVDIEAERTDRNVLGLARRFFTPAESAWLAALPPAVQARGFCRLWTCKEAWMKSDGRGLELPLDQIEVSFRPDGVELRALAPPGTTWFARELECASGYCAAAVMAGAPPEVKLQELRLPL